MGRKRHTALPKKVKAVQASIERWRRTRRKRSPMSEKLWGEATLLAREHGTYRISSALRINYENLKKRVAVAPEKGRDEATGFVEVDGARFVGAFDSARTLVEFSGADGAKLVIRLSGCEDLDVLGLADAFWKRGA